MKSNKKRFNLTEIVLTVALAAFVAPYLLGSNQTDGIKVGATTVTQKDLQQMYQIAQQENLPSYYAYISYLFGEEARSLTNPLQKYITIDTFGLSVPEETIDSFIKNMPSAQKNGKFSVIQYQNFLKKLGITESILKRKIKVFLTSKQFMMLSKQMTLKLIENSDEFINKIRKALKQVRIGEYAQVNIKLPEPEIGNPQFLSDFEDFIVFNQDKFYDPAYAQFSGVHINAKLLDSIKSDLEQKMDLNQIKVKYNLKAFAATLKNNKIHSSDQLSSSAQQSLLEDMKKKTKGGFLILQNQDQLIIYQLDEFTPKQQKNLDYFKTEVKNAWNNKEENHPAIKAWKEHYRQKQLIKYAEKIKTNQTTTATLNNILPIEFKVDQQNNKLSPEMLAIHKTLFDIKINQSKIISVNNKVFKVKLKEIKYNSHIDVPDLQKILINMIYGQILEAQLAEIYKKFNS